MLIFYLKYLVNERVWRLAIHMIYCALILLSNQLLSSSLIFPILHFTTRCFPGVWSSISIYPMVLILIVMVSSENKLGHGSHHQWYGRSAIPWVCSLHLVCRCQSRKAWNFLSTFQLYSIWVYLSIRNDRWIISCLECQFTKVGCT